MKTFDSMSADRLGEILARFSRLRIAVLGDYFLDKYLTNPRWPRSVWKRPRRPTRWSQQVTARAAGTVMANLSALEAGRLLAIGLTGDDGESYDLQRADRPALRDRPSPLRSPA